MYPPPTTPPEPAPPDHLLNSKQKRATMLSASQTSLDEITCKFYMYTFLATNTKYLIYS